MYGHNTAKSVITIITSYDIVAINHRLC